MSAEESFHRSYERFRCRAEADAGVFQGEIRSVSMNGAFLSARRPVALGKELRLSFRLPDGTPVSAVAEVRRVTNDANAVGLGIRFVRINHEAHQAILRFTRQG
ncbi:MAG: PilZ domain-containing protein [Myxococcota bacterium]